MSDYRNFWNTERWYSSNSLAQLFQLQKRLPKRRHASMFCQKLFKKTRVVVCLFVFLFQKAQNFQVVFWTLQFCSNLTSMRYNIFFFEECIEKLPMERLPMSSLATEARKRLMANVLQILIFRSGISCYHWWSWHWSLKFLHTCS